VGGVCTGGNKASVWIYTVIAIASAFLITLIIMIILMMKKKHIGIVRVKRRLEHSGKTVYYSNKIKKATARSSTGAKMTAAKTK